VVPTLHTCNFECLVITFTNQGLISPHIPILMKCMYCLCMDGWFSLGATPYIPFVPHPNKLHVLYPPVGILISCAYLPHLHVTFHLYQHTSLTHSRTRTHHTLTLIHTSLQTHFHTCTSHTHLLTYTHTHTTTLTHKTPTLRTHPHPHLTYTHTPHTHTHHTEGVTTHAPALP